MAVISKFKKVTCTCFASLRDTGSDSLPDILAGGIATIVNLEKQEGP